MRNKNLLMKNEISNYFNGLARNFTPALKGLIQINEFRLIIFLLLLGMILTQVCSEANDRATISIVFSFLLLGMSTLLIFSKFGRHKYSVEVIVIFYLFSLLIITVFRKSLF